MFLCDISLLLTAIVTTVMVAVVAAQVPTVTAALTFSPPLSPKSPKGTTAMSGVDEGACSD